MNHLLSCCSQTPQQTFVGLEDVFNTSSAWQLYVFQEVLKTSWRHFVKMSWRSLKDILQDLLKTSSKRLGRRKIVTLKTSSMSQRRLGDVLKILWRQTEYIQRISVYLSGDNKSKCVSNKSVFHKSISDNSNANPKCIN